MLHRLVSLPPLLAVAVDGRHQYVLTGLLTFFLLLGFPPTAVAQYRLDTWTTDNGLPHNAIRAMRQTRDGYLWVSTIYGIARFDGVRFRVFNKANTPGITTNHFAFRGLWEDRRGTLWIGTYDGGVIPLPRRSLHRTDDRRRVTEQ